MKEITVEERLKTRLERYGFRVLKLKTLGSAGADDRLILRPKYAPGPPCVVEVKRPGETPRLLQRTVAADWRARGVDVRRFVSTFEEVDALIDALVQETKI